MSNANDGIGQREVAYRLFAAEYEDADFTYSESDEDRAPNYVVTPTGARVNRLFVVGVLTEVEAVSEDVLRGRVVDPTGAFVLYAGQYQPDEQAFLEAADTPTFVAVTGKARTFQPEDSQQVFTSVRPESINEVDGETRDSWTVQAAEQTLARVGRMAHALSTGLEGDQLRAALVEDGVEEGLADGIALALGHYGTTPTYLDAIREIALDGARVVAGQRDEVRKLDRTPDVVGDVTATDLLGSVDFPQHGDSDRQPAESPTADSGVEAATGMASSETSETSASEISSSEVSTTTTEPSETSSSEAPDALASETTSTAGADSQSSETDGDEVGDFSPGEGLADSDADDLDDFDPGEFEMAEETRREVEQEYGTEFQSGTEVDEPGTAGIDPETETESPASAESESTPAKESEPASSLESEPTPAAEEPDDDVAEPVDESAAVDASETDTAVDASETDTAVDASETDTAVDDSAESAGAERPDDLQEAVVEGMRELDEGTGANREKLITEMEQRYGVDADEVEEAIQAALMDGQCYEPDDTSLKPI